MRLIIVEDDPLQRESFRILFSCDPNIEVVGAFASAEELLPCVDELKPDMLLADLGLPGMPGLELIRTLRQCAPQLVIMVLTIFEDRETVFAAIKAGASGYLLKGSSPRQLIEALHDLDQGGAPMSAKIARSVINELQAGAVSPEVMLSQREKKILGDIARGLAYKEIADELSISAHTVHAHIKAIYGKLHAKDRRDALAKARQRGIIS